VKKNRIFEHGDCQRIPHERSHSDLTVTRGLRPAQRQAGSRAMITYCQKRDLVACHPLPMKGIVVAVIVRNCTLVSRGRLAI